MYPLAGYRSLMMAGAWLAVAGAECVGVVVVVHFVQRTWVIDQNAGGQKKGEKEERRVAANGESVSNASPKDQCQMRHARTQQNVPFHCGEVGGGQIRL